MTEFVCMVRGGEGGTEMRSGLNPGPLSHRRVSCLVGKDYTVLLQTTNPSSSEQEHVGGPDLSRPLQEDEELSAAGSQ